jgi:glycosyltransferase involved in cell wall biosynthesis
MVTVQVHGDFTHATGLGVAASRTLEALATTGLHVEPFELAQGLTATPHSGHISTDKESTESFGAPERLAATGLDGTVQLIHTNPDHLLDCARTNTGRVAALIRERYPFIGYWAWEAESGIPASWERLFGRVAEIWVPSHFVARAVAHFVPCPVICIPHPIKPRAIKDTDFLRRLGRQGCYFLSIFDGLSGFSRKNPLGLVRAWLMAFPKPSNNFTLIIKVKNISASQVNQISGAAGDRPDILILRGLLSTEDLYGLISGARAYVSLHRSEGFGLTLAEAMAQGIPVIGTGYSGNLDFMTRENSLLVDYKPTQLLNDEGYYKRGTQWAEPVLENAATHILSLANNPTLAAQIGEKGRKAVLETLGPQRVGAMMEARIRLVHKYLRIPRKA